MAVPQLTQNTTPRSLQRGLLHFLRSVAKLNVERPPLHAPDQAADPEEARRYPTPEWLEPRRVLNWAVVGRVGAGKSSLINALRGILERKRTADGSVCFAFSLVIRCDDWHF